MQKWPYFNMKICLCTPLKLLYLIIKVTELHYKSNECPQVANQ